MALIVLGMEVDDMVRKLSVESDGLCSGRDDLAREVYSVERIARCLVMQGSSEE